MAGYKSRALEIAAMKADRYERLVQESRRLHRLGGPTEEEWAMLEIHRKEIKDRRKALEASRGLALDRDTDLVAQVRETEADFERARMTAIGHIRVAESGAASKELAAYEKGLLAQETTASDEAREDQQIELLAKQNARIMGSDIDEAEAEIAARINDLYARRVPHIDEASAQSEAYGIVERRDAASDAETLIEKLVLKNPEAPVWKSLTPSQYSWWIAANTDVGAEITGAEQIAAEKRDKEAIIERTRIKGVGAGPALKLDPEERLGLAKGTDYTPMANRAAYNKMRELNPEKLSTRGIDTFEAFVDSTDKDIVDERARMYASIPEIKYYGDVYSDEALAIQEFERQLRADEERLSPEPGWTEADSRQQALRWETERHGTKKEQRALKRDQDLYDISAEVFGGKSQGDISIWARQRIDNPWERSRFMALTRKWPLNDKEEQDLKGIIEGVQKEALTVKDREGNPILKNGEEIDILDYIDYQLNDSDIVWSPEHRAILERSRATFLRRSFDKPTDDSMKKVRLAYEKIQKEADRGGGADTTSVPIDLLEDEVDDLTGVPEAETPTPTGSSEPGRPPRPGQRQRKKELKEERKEERKINREISFQPQGAKLEADAGTQRAQELATEGALASAIGTSAWKASQKENIAPDSKEIIKSMSNEAGVKFSASQLTELAALAELDDIDEKSKDKILTQIVGNKPQDLKAGRMSLGTYRTITG